MPRGPVVRPWREGDEARILAEEARILAKKDKERERKSLLLRQHRLETIIAGDATVQYAREETERLKKKLQAHEDTLASHKETSEAARKELVEVEAQLKRYSGS